MLGMNLAPNQNCPKMEVFTVLTTNIIKIKTNRLPVELSKT
jgi:hypothetical protein